MNDHETEPMPLANRDLEQCVLGAMLLSGPAAQLLSRRLTGTDFYHPRHMFVFDAITAALAAGEPTDPVAVAEHLTATGDLGRAGGAPYLHTLAASVPTAAHAEWHADQVAELAARRRLVEACTDGVRHARNTGIDLVDVANRVQETVHTATARRSSESRSVTFTDGLDDTLTEILDPDATGRGLSTRIGDLDRIIGGLKPGQLIIVAGRPGAGKSVLATDLVRAVSIQQIEPSLMFSLEMSSKEVRKRILAAQATVNLARITNGGMTEADRDKVVEAAEKLRGVMITIDDSANVDLGYIRSEARRIQADTGLGLIVVDYLQLMSAAKSSDNRATEVGEISRGLKQLARELEVPIVAAAQLNRMSEQRSDKRPQLSDLRESGSIEQDADVVILLHRPDYHDPESERAGEIDLIVGKNRNGPVDTATGMAQLMWARIVDIEAP